MKFTEEDIGSRIIETITSGLYDGNLNCLREYVQNSVDSKAENVKIYFENSGKNLVIQDDGSGMVKDELREALAIGKSGKSESDVGWRGIGIWSGVPSCNKIEIISKAENSEINKVVIDCDQLRLGYKNENRALEILSNSTSEIEIEKAKKYNEIKSSTFTLVRLKSILPVQQRIIFKEKEIERYLEKVLPVPFSKDFIYMDEINKWLNKNKVPCRVINVTFNGKSIYRPPFDSDIFFEIVIKKKFRIKNHLIAVGWFLSTKNNKKLSDQNRGIFFKKKGFTIGDETLIIKQYGHSYNEWQYGEIHIISKDLRENASRNNFEYNEMILDEFYKDVGTFIGELSTVNRYQSSNMAPGPIERIKNDLAKGNLSSANKRVKKAKKRLSTKQTYPTDNSLKELKPLIDRKSSQDIKVITTLDNKIRKKKPNKIKQGKDHLMSVISNSHPEVKKSTKLKTIKGIEHPELSMTDPIKDILQQKTGLVDNEIFQLSQATYGWEKVNASTKSPHLVIDPKKGRKSRNRNLQFGVMVYIIHDLFVNLYKHEKGKLSLGWFENVSDEEKLSLLAEMNATVSLIYRLIEKSQKYEP